MLKVKRLLLGWFAALVLLAKKELQLLRSIGRRFVSPTPAFWRKVQGRAAGTAAGITGLAASGNAPDTLLPYLKGAALVFGAVALVAQVTCSDSPADATPPTDSSAS